MLINSVLQQAYHVTSIEDEPFCPYTDQIWLAKAWALLIPTISLHKGNANHFEKELACPESFDSEEVAFIINEILQFHINTGIRFVSDEWNELKNRIKTLEGKIIIVGPFTPISLSYFTNNQFLTSVAMQDQALSKRIKHPSYYLRSDLMTLYRKNKSLLISTDPAREAARAGLLRAVILEKSTTTLKTRVFNSLLKKYSESQNPENFVKELECLPEIVGEDLRRMYLTTRLDMQNLAAALQVLEIPNKDECLLRALNDKISEQN